MQREECLHVPLQPLSDPHPPAQPLQPACLPAPPQHRPLLPERTQTRPGPSPKGRGIRYLLRGILRHQVNSSTPFLRKKFGAQVTEEGEVGGVGLN